MNKKTWIFTIISCILIGIGSQNLFWAYKSIEVDKFYIVDKCFEYDSIDNEFDSIFIVQNNIGQFKFPIQSKTYENYNISDSITFKAHSYAYIDLYLASQNDETKHELMKLNPTPLLATHSNGILSIMLVLSVLNFFLFLPFCISLLIGDMQYGFDANENFIEMHYLLIGFILFANTIILICLE